MKNLQPYIRERLWPRLRGEPVTVQDAYRTSSTQGHREALDALVKELLGKHGLELRLRRVLEHRADAPRRIERPRR